MDERVRLFCVAAQVVDVDHIIQSAITECMRLGTHAVRTAMVPLPFSGVIGTPTVSRLICEHVLQCFGFPKALPEEVEKIMHDIVLGNLKQFMTVTLTQFLVVSSAAAGLAVGTMGIGAILGVAGCFLSTPPTARMLLKVSTDVVLILDRSFRYNGKYVSIKQIEDAARQYASIKTTTFGGKEILLQEYVHAEVDRMIPLKNLMLGFRFQKLRTNLEELIFKNRFDRPPEYEEKDPFSEKTAELAAPVSRPAELPSNASNMRSELAGTSYVAELEGTYPPPKLPNVPELVGSEISPISPSSPPSTRQASELSAWPTTSMLSQTSSVTPVELSTTSSASLKLIDSKSSGGFFSRKGKSMKIKKTKT